jgi:DNA-binding XRE family transcriptional regulator
VTIKFAHVRRDRPRSLLDARLRSGLRQVDVAREAGCSTSLVSMMERGYRPSEQTCATIACVVNATVAELWP